MRYLRGKFPSDEAFLAYIRERLFAPDAVCALLREAGFEEIRRSDRLLPEGDAHGTTWYIVARKPQAPR